MTIQINRYDIDATLSVSRDGQHLGMIMCPTADHTDYVIVREDGDLHFDAEAAAVQWLDANTPAPRW